MGFAILIGVLGGQYLDDVFDTAPVLFWIGFAVGLGAAAKAVYDGLRVASRTVVPDDEKNSKKI
ncbi:MAG: AtpZ/AtpI family protein [Proteobacteria bacterium]|jgi:F0F1-type ATP synthase assembly protein I|nr:AtpZ/AtpI family protein [Pseudomonadota bacterium]